MIIELIGSVRVRLGPSGSVRPVRVRPARPGLPGSKGPGGGVLCPSMPIHTQPRHFVSGDMSGHRPYMCAWTTARARPTLTNLHALRPSALALESHLECRFDFSPQVLTSG